MEFGVVLQPNPPASGLIAMMKRAEAGGFGYGWTFDSHVLWQETFVLYPRILESTSTMIVGPMVTNPGTRDWSVIASMFATLNDELRQPHDLRYRPRRLGPPVHRAAAGVAVHPVVGDDGDQGARRGA